MSKEKEYKEPWGKGLNENEIRLLNKLRTLLSDLNNASFNEDSEVEAWRAKRDLKKKIEGDDKKEIPKGEVDKITFSISNKQDPVSITDPTIIDFLVSTFWKHYPTKEPKNGSPSNFTRLLENGGYDILKELKKSFTNDYLIAFLRANSKRRIVSLDKEDNSFKPYIGEIKIPKGLTEEEGNNFLRREVNRRAENSRIDVSKIEFESSIDITPKTFRNQMSAFRRMSRNPSE